MISEERPKELESVAPGQVTENSPRMEAKTARFKSFDSFT